MTDMREKYGSRPGPNWGTQVIDPQDRIDITKPHRTRSGKRVIGLECQLHNSTGDEVTFPIKGTIVVREATTRTPASLRYSIWTLDGRSGVTPVNMSSEQCLPRHDLVPDTSPVLPISNIASEHGKEEN